MSLRFGRVLVLLLVVAAAAGGGYWAGREALEPPSNPLDETVQPVVYMVEDGTVGRSLTFTAIAEWDLTPVGENSAGGVVTSVQVAAGDTVSAGDVLYSVNLRPVVIAEGAVPMFRSLAVKSEGADVAQLQSFLLGLGFFSGDVDGSFGSSTRSAVKAWQASLGVSDTGVVEVGDLVFVPQLPARIALSDGVWVGARLSGGERVVQVVPSDPVFRIPLAIEQASLVPLSADVFVTYPDGVWDARIVQASESPETGQLNLVLEGIGGGSVCGDVCADWVELTDRSDFRAEVVVIPETNGPAVPVAAISSGPGNQAYVTAPDGSQLPVTVIESSNGLSVVDGIDAGTEILLPVTGS